MSLSTPFIYRPVGTALLTVALGLAGGIAYKFLPTSPLPQVRNRAPTGSRIVHGTRASVAPVAFRIVSVTVIVSLTRMTAG